MPKPAPSAPHRPQGTLFDDETTAAIAIGWSVQFEDQVTDFEVFRTLDARVCALAEQTGRDLRLLVPGDTYTDPDLGSFAAPVVGEVVTLLRADGAPPLRFDPRAIAARHAAFAPVPAAALTGLGEGVPGVASVAPRPDIHLLSWGPLSYAAVHCGVPLDGAARDQAKLKYATTQDTDQTWADAGVDGKFVAGVEFARTRTLDFSEAALAAIEQEVGAVLPGPGWFLIVRYD